MTARDLYTLKLSDNILMKIQTGQNKLAAIKFGDSWNTYNSICENHLESQM